MTKKEIETKKAELLNKINEVKSEEELAELRKEVEAINKEVPEVEEQRNDGTITHEEERSLLTDVDNLEQRKVEITNVIKNDEEERKVKRSKEEVLKSAEYRTAWAKKLMGLSEDRFTEEEKRALGDAVTTTATTFTQSAEGTQGINNGGLFIPTDVRMVVLKCRQNAYNYQNPYIRFNYRPLHPYCNG